MNNKLPTPDCSVEKIIQVLVKSHQSDPYPELSRRVKWLKDIEKLVLLNQDVFAEKISKDFGNRSHKDTYLAEVLPVVSAARHAIKNTKKWMKAKKVRTSPVFWFGHSLVFPQPIGVVAVISPWNYPLQLSLIPTINALSAGNRVLIKPSEKTSEFSSFLQKCITDNLDSSIIQVVEGDHRTAKLISECSEINHLFFTGSTKVGKIIAESAAANLVPTTLELGGKSPAYISTTANLKSSVKSIIAGKVMNSGQTCVAPDYLLVHQSHQDKFLDIFLQELKNLYDESKDLKDFTSLINKSEVHRINEMEQDAISKGAVIHKALHTNKNVEITNTVKLLLNCKENMQVMDSEIFGPLLPVIFVNSSEKAIEYVNAHDEPLALYLFGNNSKEHNKWVKKTRSGGITINDCLLHVAQDDLPFGGVGNSGYGHYHGIWGFNNFSNQKSIFIQSKVNMTSLFKPPFGKIYKRFSKYFAFWV